MGLSRGSRHGNDLTKIGGQSGKQIVGRTSSCMYLRFSISYHMIYILRLDPVRTRNDKLLGSVAETKNRVAPYYKVAPLVI